MSSRPRWQANPGTAQNERLPAALDPSDSRYFRVDERTLSDLVENAATASRHLVFRDLRNRDVGRWDRWFEKNEAFVLARIVSVDVERLREEFLNALEASPHALLTLRILALAHRIDEWHRALAVVDRPACVALCAHIHRLVAERLAGLLQWTLAQAADDATVTRFAQRLDPIWTLPGNAPPPAAASGGRSRTRVVFFTFLDAIAQLRKRALADLPQTLASDGHEPSAALFLSFLQLYGTIQEQMNTFTARHTDFYYRDCLRMAPRAAEPDSVHVVCRRVPGMEGDVILPAGTPVAIDKDSQGREFLYRTDEPLAVTDATVAALYTLRMERDPLISPERELGYVTRAKAQRMVPDDGSIAARHSHGPLFGGTGPRAGVHGAEDAEVGLALASSLFLLAEGEREVRISLEFQQPADRDVGATEAVVRFSKEGPSGGASGTFPELLERLFTRFAEMEPPGARSNTAPFSARTLADGAAPRIATDVLIRRIRALTDEQAWTLRHSLSTSPGQVVLRSRVELPIRQRAGIRRALHQRLGRPGGDPFDLRFETARDARIEVQLLVNGYDVMPGGLATQRALYTVPVLYSAYLVQRLLHTDTESVFFARFGQLFCRWMLIDQNTIGAEDIRALKTALRGVPRPRVPPRLPQRRKAEDITAPDRADVMACLRGRKRPVRDYLFNKLFVNLAEVRLTGADGWFSPADGFVLGAEPGVDTLGRSDLTVVFRLRPDAPSVVPYADAVHGGGWRTALPVVRLRLRQGSSLFPYSALADLVLVAARIDVEVSGVRDLVLHNNFGRLDPSKAFNPFGPLPARGSYLVFGSPELARKPLTALSLNVEWGQLPEDDGGFAAHYRGYPGTFHNRSQQAEVTILRDGRWEPRNGGAGGMPLFAADSDEGRVPRHATLHVPATDLRNHFRTSRSVPDGESFQFDLGVRAGFFRLELTEPADPFGHREYPGLLTRVVTANAKRRQPLPLPNGPYTPLIERLTVDYRASSSMNLAHEIPEERVGTEEQIFLVHPFGVEEIYPAIRGVPAGPLPRYDADGNLFIGLRAGSLAGPLSLMFHLRDETARRRADRRERPRFQWSYLASNRWRPLAPARVVSDTTQGFLTSGIVHLDIPDDIDRNNTVLPSDLFWLRLTASDRLDSVAGLHGVHAQAVRCTRDREAVADPTETPHDGAVARPRISVPGLASAEQIGASFGGRVMETALQLRCRTGERLRHKNRASVHWDYERLVLERFPKVFKVKCFASMAGDALGPRPGGVLVVVIPHPERGTTGGTRAPKMNATELERIQAFIAERASPFADIVVRNATYERIQVRCAVRFRPGAQSGLHLQRLNADIIDRLSPWRRDGAGAQFDWSLRKEEVEAWIREFDYVASVARVSLLQVAEADEGDHWLGDSARIEPEMTATGLWTGKPSDVVPGTLRPRFPWSLALPARLHALEPMTDSMDDAASATGIAGLEIGGTFVVGGARDG